MNFFQTLLTDFWEFTIFIAALCALTTFRASSETIYLGNAGETSKNWTSNNLKKQYKGNTPTKFSPHGW